MGPNHQVSDHKQPVVRVGFVASEGAPSPPEAFSLVPCSHVKRGFDQGRQCRQLQGFPGLERTIREFEARIALMPRSGVGAGSVPALRPRRVGIGKQELGSVETELKPQQHRRGLNSVGVQGGP